MTKRFALAALLLTLIGSAAGAQDALAITSGQLAQYNAVADTYIGPAGRCTGRAQGQIVGDIPVRVNHPDGVQEDIHALGIADGVGFPDDPAAPTEFYNCNFRVVANIEDPYDACLVVLHERLHLEGVKHDAEGAPTVMAPAIDYTVVRVPACMAATVPVLTNDEADVYIDEHLIPAPYRNGNDRAWYSLKCKATTLSSKRCTLALHRAGKHGRVKVKRVQYQIWLDANWRTIAKRY